VLVASKIAPAVKTRHADADTSGTLLPSMRPKHAFRRIGRLLAPVAQLPRERGASAVEYAILVAMIAAVIVVVMAALGVSVLDLFTHFSDTLHTV
jgi:Flp pilus assembly pilin Flp